VSTGLNIKLCHCEHSVAITEKVTNNACRLHVSVIANVGPIESLLAMTKMMGGVLFDGLIMILEGNGCFHI
jgi:hypothetical protein